MSVREREEERQKSCPSRGVGLAAAAIGVGVGAALYYFFNKRAEHPDTDGATTSGWTCEEALSCSSSSDSDDEYSTVSEHSTTDTSMNTEQTHGDDDDDDSFNTISSEESSNMTSDCSNEPLETSLSSYTSIGSMECSIDSDRALDQDWDVTNSSLGVPSSSVRDRTPSPLSRFVTSLNYFVTPRNRRQPVPEDNQRRSLREEHFRQRSWSLEECSICCEVMLKDQPLRQLACSHNFHAACVQPWLEEQQTCPNCRKLA